MPHLRSSRPVALTIVTRNHLHYARALAHSIRSFHPEVELIACVVDGVREDGDSDAGFRVVLGEHLGIDNWSRFRFQYLADEVCYAVKPFLLEWALRHTSGTAVLYFDADVFVYHPLDALVSTVERYEIVLTPQLSSPAATRESELISRQYGVYNAGFVGVRASDVARDFVRWWQRWTYKHGVIDFGGSLACDQAWLDLVPGLFPGVYIERGAGYNLARWNLCERGLWRSPEGTWMVATDPLVFFHFSGFHLEQSPDGSTVYWPGLDIHRFPMVKELCLEYAKRLDRFGAATVSRLPYRFACLSDGTEIDPLWREVVRMDHPELQGVDDPIELAATPDLRDRFERARLDARMSRSDWRSKLHEEEVAALRSTLAGLRGR
jgi:hypothetical protein